MGIFVTRQVFTVNNFIAVIGLAGVAVNDSIVLIDFIHNARLKGAKLRDAVIEGCQRRMRPILLTTITTALGLLPTALGIPYYSMVWGGMANSFVYGVSTATLLVITVTPPIYELIESIKIKIAGRDIYLTGELHENKVQKKIKKIRRVIKKVSKQKIPQRIRKKPVE